MNHLHPEHDEYELSRTNTFSSEEQDLLSLDRDFPSHDHDNDHDLDHSPLLSDSLLLEHSKPTLSTRFASLTPTWLRKQPRTRRSTAKSRRSPRLRTCSLRSFYRKLACLVYAFIITIITLLVVGGTFYPSYTHLPPHYASLRQRVQASDDPGRANLQNEKIFIAASIFDKGGKLSGGPWADNVLELIQLLGPSNTFLSIYVNDAGLEAKASLNTLRDRVPCDNALVFEEHLDLDEIPHITLLDSTQRVKRIEYLAEVRNRALRPLVASKTRFDKLLYLNDVVFHPEEAAQLLFSTHASAHGVADYRAACAVDFINPFKFYDTFATRDMEGYSMGLPFFPWFSAGGSEQTHQDVIDGTDAVRVKSCWGGMVAFDAKFFQSRPYPGFEPVTAGHGSPSNLSLPYKFRAEQDLYWDASECCLIQADIQNPEPGNSGIYVNPFVRVAYDTKTLSWLRFVRRFERLYTPIHFMLDILVSMPHYNPRRDEEPWQEVVENVWIKDEKLRLGGSFKDVSRLATHSGFCGRRNLAVIKENIMEGERNWESLAVPSSA
ncbi:hypothetical protein PV10_03494 [Exophiala mesophila]|uniref:Glycosyltransferase family 69 protein n=1 Tax=Exophiala mesophila TaxID=212818 RepID=A0A0D2AAE1_EXOME|nr:uncharacterized protein PV10_03494 [Exophiala mesophila]KIV95893.1 hypothetical protein PV10_03494 [Exophiala mesophila]